jgi:DNA-binding transcriptional ArsR family regulator
MTLNVVSNVLTGHVARAMTSREFLMAIPPDISPTIEERSLSLATLSEADALPYATWFKALADPTRIRILNLLAQRADSVCFCDIADQFSLGQSTISHHLKVLRDAHLLHTTRQGTYMHYQVHQASVAELPEAVRRILHGAPGE